MVFNFFNNKIVSNNKDKYKFNDDIEDDIEDDTEDESYEQDYENLPKTYTYSNSCDETSLLCKLLQKERSEILNSKYTIANVSYRITELNEEVKTFEDLEKYCYDCKIKIKSIYEYGNGIDEFLEECKENLLIFCKVYEKVACVFLFQRNLTECYLNNVVCAPFFTTKEAEGYLSIVHYLMNR